MKTLPENSGSILKYLLWCSKRIRQKFILRKLSLCHIKTLKFFIINSEKKLCFMLHAGLTGDMLP